jgi:hypothetical protein
MLVYSWVVHQYLQTVCTTRGNTVPPERDKSLRYPPGTLMGLSALVICMAFLVHNINALYIEPNFLGFKDPRIDYADLDKLKNALGSLPWRLSGLGHLLSGFACVVLGLSARQLFRDSRLAAARLLPGAGLVAGVGFLLTAITDQAGAGAVKLLAAQNPELEDAAYLSLSIVRIIFNCLAQVGLGWFAWQLGFCGLKTGMLPRGFCWFGYLSGLTGLLMAVTFIPTYLLTVLLWSGWLAVLMLQRAVVSAARDA